MKNEKLIQSHNYNDFLNTILEEIPFALYPEFNKEKPSILRALLMSNSIANSLKRLDLIIELSHSKNIKNIHDLKNFLLKNEKLIEAHNDYTTHFMTIIKSIFEEIPFNLYPEFNKKKTSIRSALFMSNSIADFLKRLDLIIENDKN